MQAWKSERRAPLDLVLAGIRGLVDVVLDYAYECQGSLVCAMEKLTEFDAWIIVCLSNHTIATASHNSSVCVWNVKTGDLMSTLEGHTRKVCHLTMYRSELVSVSRDCTARVWDVDHGLCVRTLSHPAAVDFAAGFDAYLLTACADGSVRMWTGEVCSSIYVYNHGVLRTPRTTTEAGTHQILGLEVVCDSVLCLRTIVRTIIYTYTQGKFSAAYQTVGLHQDDMFVTPNNTLVIYNAQAIYVWGPGAQHRILWTGTPIFAVCMLHDGRVAASFQDHKIRVFNLLTEEAEILIDCLHSRTCPEFDCAQCELGNHNFFWHLIQLPDGRLAGAEGACVNVWELNSGECIWWKYYGCDITNLNVIDSKLVVGCGTPCDECECKPGYGCKNCGQLYVVE